jgi:hypothetical protein
MSQKKKLIEAHNMKKFENWTYNSI